MIATGCNDRVIDSLIDNNNDDDDYEDIPLNSNLEIVTQFISTTPPALLPVVRLTSTTKMPVTPALFCLVKLFTTLIFSCSPSKSCNSRRQILKDFVEASSTHTVAASCLRPVHMCSAVTSMHVVALRTFPTIQFERNTSLENGNNQFHRFGTPSLYFLV